MDLRTDDNVMKARHSCQRQTAPLYSPWEAGAYHRQNTENNPAQLCQSVWCTHRTQAWSAGGCTTPAGMARGAHILCNQTR